MRSKTKFIALSRAFAFFFSVLIVFIGCGEKELNYNHENDALVEAISPLNIGRIEPIVVSFTNDIICKPEDAFTLSPAIRGAWKIENSRVATFIPEKAYKASSNIVLKVDCEKAFSAEVAKGFYMRRFYVTNPSYVVQFDEIRLNEENKSYSISGSITTDINEPLATVKKMLKASWKGKVFGKKIAIDWDKESDSESKKFVIRGITSKEKAQSLLLEWNGKALGLNKKQDKAYCGEKVYTIPALPEFAVIDINRSKKNSILVSFSRSLDTKQDLNDLVVPTMKQGKVKRFVNTTVRGNVLTIYNDSNFSGIATLTILGGVKSSDGVNLKNKSVIDLDEHWDLPEVRFLNDGIIIPTSQGTCLPVETKNLSGLLVQAFEIYDRNMIQFLQVNELDETRQLYRVGEPVWEKNISFEWDNSMQNKFISRGLDLSELAKKYPRGMFQIRISFRKKNVKYICSENHDDFSSLKFPEDTIGGYDGEAEQSYWDYWDNLDWEVRNTFWTYRNDPCHPAFYSQRYNSGSLIERNVMVSDLGIIAKKTLAGDLYIAVADIKNAKPIPAAEVSLYSFVGTTLYSAKTDTDGFVRFSNTDSARFITASLNGQTSYLKLSEGSGLSVSHFETGGIVPQGGIKGFIYGERGVWRPGDNLYLTFILEDKDNKVPSDIPVTFELSDPMGRITDSQTLTEGLSGFYAIKTKTEEKATTGLWQAKIKVGGNEWTKNIRIETVIPNHLSVELESENKILENSSNTFTLSGQWLHGAETPYYKADVSVSFSETPVKFDGYSEYSFVNPERSVESRRETVWEGKLDSASKANFTVSMDAGKNVPGLLNANFTSRIFEPSGIFSSARKSFKYSPYSRYVGLKLPKGDESRGMLLTDVDHTADLVMLSPDGKPIEDGSVNWTIYKLEWKWWWEKDALTSASYVSDSSYSKIDSGTADIKNGRGSFNFKVKYPSWGRYMVVADDAKGGHSAAKIVYIDWPGWAGRAQESGGGSAAMVTLALDKKQYTVGQTATITFASAKDSNALITIEKSGKILKQSWVKTNEGTTKYMLPITGEMAPNVYVHVTLLQKHLQTANSLPVRLYGVAPVFVDNPESNLKPVIESPQKYEPGKEAVVSISEANGKAMTYTLAVVDDGLLGLTNFHAPNPHDEFYKKEASSLLNWDIYSYIMNAYSGKLETLLSIGGSEDSQKGGDQNENRFEPVVKFFGPYTLKPGEKAAIKFKMPQYIGSVRAIVVAGNNGAYGCAEKSVVVKSDLMVQASLPRTLGFSEQIDIPVTVFNGMNQNQKITVSLKADGASINKKSQLVEVKGGDNAVVTFTASDFTKDTVTFTSDANASGVSASEETAVTVLSRGIPVTYKKSFVVKGNSNYVEQIPSPSEIETMALSLELSSLPPLDLSTRLEYLISYPHGCIEQITSGGFPQLYLSSFIKLDASKSEKIKKHVQSVIDRYNQYQTSSGGFAYWTGGTVPSPWGSCYGAHFLTEAKKLGYTVPSVLYDSLLDWIETSAVEWTDDSYEDSEEVQAYKLFVLAIAGRANIGSMNRLEEKKSRLSQSAKLLLAAAYASSGREKVARELLSSFTPTSVFFRLTGGSFSSSIREQALYLFTCRLCDKENEADKTAKALAETLSSDKWLSTQETAWSLLSLLPYYKDNEKSKKIDYVVESAGKERQGTLDTLSKIEELSPSNQRAQTVRISNKSSASLYGLLTSSGMSVPGTEVSRNDGLEVHVKYKDSKGNTINPSSLKKGDSFVVDVSVENTFGKKIENIALTLPFATCWEFNNDRIADTSQSYSSSYSYQDIRDEAIYTYFDLAASDTLHLSFPMTVAYSGSYYIPAVHAEAMYDNSYGSIVPGIHIEKKQ